MDAYLIADPHAMRTRRAAWRAVACFVSALLFWSCAPTISGFSPIAFEQAPSLKVDALAVMDKATGSYADHEQDVAALSLRLAKAYEFAKGRPKNEISAHQWDKGGQGAGCRCVRHDHWSGERQAQAGTGEVSKERRWRASMTFSTR